MTDAIDVIETDYGRVTLVSDALKEYVVSRRTSAGNLPRKGTRKYQELSQFVRDVHGAARIEWIRGGILRKL